MATQVNLAVFLVFLFLELTEIFLAIGNFSSSAGLSQFGGYIGLLPPWSPGTPRRRGFGSASPAVRLPVGKPLIS